MYVCMYVCMCTWQRLNNIGLVRGLCGLFATRLVTESGGLATNPPCDKPVEGYSTLHRRLRQGFVTEASRQRFVTEGGDRDKHLFRGTAIYIHTHTCIILYMYMYVYMQKTSRRADR